jgi:hypothetical protein
MAKSTTDRDKRGDSESHRGRTPLPLSRRRTKKLQVPLNAEELREIKAGALRERDKPAPWARRILLLAAEGRLVIKR